ncbi:MAG: DUF1232 domain-containing protein [Candidatus Marinimicrobia bacterium]|nr:DUF1232 domain-containing protein [Candidatus Neomarinimicrobiota bacterium]
MSKESNFYIKLRNSINEWAGDNKNQYNKFIDFILFVPDFFYLLWKLEMNDRVSSDDKVKIGLLIAYFISPIDLFPELIFGPIGFMDDLVVTAHLINSLMVNYKEIIYYHWNNVSNQDLLESIHKILASIDNLIGKPLWNRLKNKFSI